MAGTLHQELVHNFETFDKAWPPTLLAARDAISAHRGYFEDSYVRICSIQAWRLGVMQKLDSEGAEAFFFEAQNDLLTSHWLARSGAFRPALKALRSAIENIYFSLYYKDHSVELELWETGKHRSSFTELHSYFEAHPHVSPHPLAKASLAHIKKEYSTLSQAVHGSAKAFRMTQNLQEIRLWSSDAPSISKWASREKAVIQNINILLLHCFRERLLGASNRETRSVLSLVIPQAKHREIATTLQVKLRM